MAARTTRSEYANSSSIAAATRSRPRRAQSSAIRLSASRLPASCARRSPLRSSGFRMRETSDSTVAASSRVGGMITPSSSSVREPGGRLPGSDPPTSAWCARVTAYPSSVRVTIVRSGRCVPPAYGSFRIHGSPGAGSCAITAATASGIAPRCTGMCSACVTIRPRWSNRAVEQSRRSLMLAENAERMRTAPISSAMARSDAPITWSSMGIIPSSGGRASRARRCRRPSPRVPRRSRRRARAPAGRSP